MDLIGVRHHGLSVAVRREIDRATWASGWPSCFYFPQKTGSYLTLFFRPPLYILRVTGGTSVSAEVCIMDIVCQPSSYPGRHPLPPPHVSTTT